jgi:hypothetical protein
MTQIGHPPVEWNTTTGWNIVWSVELGNETFGRPVVAGDAVYVGTDNTRHMNPAWKEESGVLMAFRATDGKFLWQDLAQRVKERGLGTSCCHRRQVRRMWKGTGCTMSPPSANSVAWTRTVSAMARTVVRIGRALQENAAADIVWESGHAARLGVFPHEACNSEVLPCG